MADQPLKLVGNLPMQQSGFGDDLRGTFAAEGYLGPIPTFSPAECQRILRSLRRCPVIAPVDWSKGVAAASRSYFELACHQPILDRVVKMIGPNVMLWGAALVRRRPGMAHPWHCDIETATSANTVTVWIALEHASPSSSLWLIARSHRLGVTVQEMAHDHGQRRGVATDQEVLSWAQQRDPSCGLVATAARDGDALYFDGRLWHASQNQSRSLTRTALLLQYAAPHVSMRIPDPAQLEWPFRFLSSNPRCIMVRGTDTSGVNRLVPGPITQTEGTARLVSGTHALGPLAESTQRHWRCCPLFRGTTSQMADFACHVSVLSPGHTPHEPHVHVEEELLIMLEGEADVLMVGPSPNGAATRERLVPGSFVYHPAFQRHTITSAEHGCATYLVFKWRADSAPVEPAPEPSRIVSYREPGASATAKPPFQVRQVLETSTRHLHKLHCHLTTLQPNAGYAPHVDAYDVAILTLDGTIETLGRQVGPQNVIFYAAGEPHGITNVGPTPAEYLVFEFHGASRFNVRESRYWRQLIRALARVPRRITRLVAKRLPHSRSGR